VPSFDQAAATSHSAPGGLGSDRSWAPSAPRTWVVAVRSYAVASQVTYDSRSPSGDHEPESRSALPATETIVRIDPLTGSIA
jgi:hypothetical protein